MQKESISSIILPKLLQEILEKFRVSTPDDQENIENLLLDLHKLLGRRLVHAALHLLDNRNIIIYTNQQKTIEIAEIFKEGSIHNLVRLLLNLNYCTCEYFKENVLNQQNPAFGPYTCQHVLTLRLAVVLKHKCLEFKEVANDKLDLLLTNFLSEE